MVNSSIQAGFRECFTIKNPRYNLGAWPRLTPLVQQGVTITKRQKQSNHYIPIRPQNKRIRNLQAPGALPNPPSRQRRVPSLTLHRRWSLAVDHLNMLRVTWCLLWNGAAKRVLASNQGRLEKVIGTSWAFSGLEIGQRSDPSLIQGFDPIRERFLYTYILYGTGHSCVWVSYIAMVRICITNWLVLRSPKSRITILVSKSRIEHALCVSHESHFGSKIATIHPFVGKTCLYSFRIFSYCEILSLYDSLVFVLSTSGVPVYRCVQ